MKKVLIFTAFAALFVACGGSDAGVEAEETTASATPAKPAADAPNGETIWKQNCIACHGLYGDMGASGAFNLQVSQLTLDEKINVIKNGRNVMPAWGALLNDDQIKAVAEYTMSLKKEDATN